MKLFVPDAFSMKSIVDTVKQPGNPLALSRSSNVGSHRKCASLVEPQHFADTKMLSHPQAKVEGSTPQAKVEGSTPQAKVESSTALLTGAGVGGSCWWVELVTG